MLKFAIMAASTKFPGMHEKVMRRRLLLGGMVGLTFLLPPWLADAMAGSARRRRAPATPARAPLVMLDPGHGGKDPGAIGVSGTFEKAVALATAHELQRQMLKTGRFNVRLTRAGDEFIPLDERVRLAERAGAALFISMHADAVADHSVRGASVYTLSATASDAQSAALARRENAADRFGGPQFRNTPPEVARILASLVRQETRVGAARMQREVVSAFNAGVPLLAHPARHAGFVVLKATDIPSVLVEMGFMSNRQDEAALRRPQHRVRVAAALLAAVDAYFAAAAAPAGRMAV
jgi:N-acetylmuramoyl-L-alanine amidase